MFFFRFYFTENKVYFLPMHKSHLLQISYENISWYKEGRPDSRIRAIFGGGSDSEIVYDWGSDTGLFTEGIPTSRSQVS